MSLGLGLRYHGTTMNRETPDQVLRSKGRIGEGAEELFDAEEPESLQRDMSKARGLKNERLWGSSIL